MRIPFCWKRVLVVVCLLAFAVAGCGLIPEAAQPTNTPLLPATQTASLDPEEEIEISVTPKPGKVVSTVSTANLPASATAEYKLVVQLDYDRRLAQVHQAIRGINPSTESIDEIPLVVEANLLKGVFVPGSIRVGTGEPKIFALDERVLHVALPEPLAPGKGFSLELTYSLNIPLTFGWLSYTGKQLNLGDWYPFIPAYQPGKGFLVHNPGASGEHLVYPRVDYQVTVILAEYPEQLVVAASAPPEKVDGNTYSYKFQGGRTFALSISPDYLIKSDGVVDIYYFGEHASAAEASLRIAKDALSLYSELYAPYPYSRLAVVEGDFFDGMEFTGLFFLGAEYFAAYPGSPQSYLTALSAHETAHQWWYGLVGNDPALEPWLDEALSTYSEVFYYEKYHADLIDWWWNYRVNRFDPSGTVNSTIYAYDGFRPYVNAVYLNGARFLHEIRGEIGDEAFIAIFQEAAGHQAGLLTGEEFLNIARKHGDTEVDVIIAKYFQ